MHTAWATRPSQAFGPIPEIWNHWNKWNYVGLVQWLIGVPCYRLFRRDGQGRSGWAVSHGRDVMYGAYSWQWHSCKPLRKNQGTQKYCNVILGVCCRPPGQDNDNDKWFSEELKDTSSSTAPLLRWDFSLPEVNWEHHAADGSLPIQHFLCFHDSIRCISFKSYLAHIY